MCLSRNIPFFLDETAGVCRRTNEKYWVLCPRNTPTMEEWENFFLGFTNCQKYSSKSHIVLPPPIPWLIGASQFTLLKITHDFEKMTAFKGDIMLSSNRKITSVQGLMQNIGSRSWSCLRSLFLPDNYSVMTFLSKSLIFSRQNGFWWQI